jgi:hypothetical protein
LLADVPESLLASKGVLTLLVEAAQAAARYNPEWRRRYMHLAMRRHTSIAKVAMGRRLAVRLYWMWNRLEKALHEAGLTPEGVIHKYLLPALSAEPTEYAKFEGQITASAQEIN